MRFKNVFIVDDDKVSHFLIKKLLANNDLNVNPSFFENGFEAIEAIKGKLNGTETLPDLILLDINMPVLDGWQFLEEFKLLKNRFDKEVVINIISSSDNSVDLERAKEFEEIIEQYYLKPMTVENIKTIFSLS